jgi:hypothetical protein
MSYLRNLFFFALLSGSLFGLVDSVPKDIAVNYRGRPSIIVTFEGCDTLESGSLILSLSDGSRWLLQSATEEEKASIFESWKKGDDIRLGYGGGANRFALKNARNKDLFSVAIDPSSFAFIETPSIQKMDKNGYALILDNGSEWRVGWLSSFASHRWRPGDRLLINKSDNSKEEGYLLINLKDGSQATADMICWIDY